MKKLLVLVLFLSSSFIAVSQNAIFRMSEQIYSLPDTVQKGSTRTFGTYVTNYGDAFTGNFYYRLSVYDWNYQCYCATYENVKPIINFQQGDSLFLPLTQTFNVTGNSHFRMGGNIVVIWPKNSQNYSVTNHEAYQYFTIINPGSNNITGIEKSLVDEKIETVHPNPFVNELFIEQNHNSKIEHVSIYNMQGQKVKELTIQDSFQNLNIKTNDLPKGVYFVTVFRENQEKEIIRIVKDSE